MVDSSIVYNSTSDQDTSSLGEIIGSTLTRGDVIALVGELGGGKTWFAKGLAVGLGVASDTIITSPSFSLVNEYEGRCAFFHLDVYRLEALSYFLSAGLDEYFYQEGVVAMEWADRWPEVLPDWRLKVELTIIDGFSRKIVLSGYHPRAVEILEGIKSQL